jgi:hypothetical protein
LKVDPKSVILGSLISLILFAAYTVAVSQYNLVGYIIVPDGGLTIHGGADAVKIDSTNYGLPNVTLDRSKDNVQVYVKNTGSKDIQVSWDYTGPSGLDITLVAEFDGGIEVDPGDSFTLTRGSQRTLTIWFEDKGISPGEHSYTIVLSGS